MMRLSTPLLLVTVGLLTPLSARASEIDASARASTEAAPAPLPRLGVMADAGLPDGANASLVFRPLRWLRVHGGGSYNMISTGVRAGVTLVPFGMGPSATLEAGHYFEGNANGVAQRFAGSTFSSATLDRLGYDYGNAHLGLDLGYRRVTFFVHGGMSYMRGQIHNADSLLSSQVSGIGGNGSTEISFKQDPTVRAWFPSAKIGLLVYLR